MEKDKKNDHSVSIDSLRNKISHIDEGIVELLDERMSCVQEVARLKEESNLMFYVPEREKEIYKKVLTKAKLFPDKGLRVIFREVMSASLSLEKPLKIAYLGPEATFTHQAAMKRFGVSLNYLPEERIEDIFLDVENDRVDFGVVPIENSIEGVVNYTLDMFMNVNVYIVSEIILEIKHALMNKSGKTEDVKAIYSHPNALAQCRGWLKRHFPNVPTFETTSTAKAAKIAQENREAASIASQAASELYNLRLIANGIEDRLNNITRFLVIGKYISHKSGRDKTSIMFSIKDRVGALYHILKPIYESGVNLTRIQSRPSGRETWTYVFYIDLCGHIEDDCVKKSIDKIREETVFFKVLGSYPAEER
ncbi:MAG: prephenate dehydratase [Desulfurellaceae bacterium]|nr:prephenate dehydratase [Desulfurellaceae bacterium]